jgi:hypothetical protein
MSCGRLLAVLATALSLWPQTGTRGPAKPVTGKSARYCNPLPLEASSRDGSPQGVSLGDVTVVREGDLYYLFGTGGGAWVSPDLVSWKYHAVEVRGGRLPVAPHVAKYNGAFYMSGNSAPLYRAPNILANPARDGDSGSIPLSVNKLRAMNQRGAFTSQRPGHEAAYALDDSNGTWWEPAEDDAQPSLTVDLGSITQFEDEQLFTVDSTRIEFLARGGFGAGAARPDAPVPVGPTAFRYKIEVSTDGKACSTAVDKSNNSITRYTEFDEVPPVRCRYVRLTLTDWPRTGNAPVGVVEFTVFGMAALDARGQ